MSMRDMREIGGQEMRRVLTISSGLHFYRNTEKKKLTKRRNSRKRIGESTLYEMVLD